MNKITEKMFKKANENINQIIMETMKKADKIEYEETIKFIAWHLGCLNDNGKTSIIKVYDPLNMKSFVKCEVCGMIKPLVWIKPTMDYKLSFDPYTV